MESEKNRGAGDLNAKETTAHYKSRNVLKYVTKLNVEPEKEVKLIYIKRRPEDHAADLLDPR